MAEISLLIYRSIRDSFLIESINSFAVGSVPLCQEKVSLIPIDVKRNLVHTTQIVASTPENIFCFFYKLVL